MYFCKSPYPPRKKKLKMITMTREGVGVVTFLSLNVTNGNTRIQYTYIGSARFHLHAREPGRTLDS